MSARLPPAAGPSGPASPAASSGSSSGSAPGFRQGFLRVFNLRCIAIVYLLSQVHALSRALDWWGSGEAADLSHWIFSLAQYTRQSLLTGLSLLALIALAEGLLARWPQPRRRAVALQGAALFTGAWLGAWARFVVFNYGDPKARVEWAWVGSTVGLWTLLGAMAYALLLMLREEQGSRAQLLGAARERDALEGQQLEAQVSALNAQIEPHFLFNTLANVKRLYETSPERGRDMLVSLIAYLRAALPGMRRPETTLGQELELVRNYLTILQMRMGARLSFAIDADAPLLDARLPPMVLPTLVENAIKHGLSPLPGGGHIEIQARRHGAELAVEVRDNGQGFAGSGGSGVGLANTRARLAALFGAAAALELEAVLPHGVVARLRMPMRLAA
ncbi:MAG: histidine kinase [Burkholderiaceae bacterium]